MVGPLLGLRYETICDALQLPRLEVTGEGSKSGLSSQFFNERFGAIEQQPSQPLSNAAIWVNDGLRVPIGEESAAQSHEGLLQRTPRKEVVNNCSNTGQKASLDPQNLSSQIGNEQASVDSRNEDASRWQAQVVQNDPGVEITASKIPELLLNENPQDATSQSMQYNFSTDKIETTLGDGNGNDLFKEYTIDDDMELFPGYTIDFDMELFPNNQE